MTAVDLSVGRDAPSRWKLRLAAVLVIAGLAIGLRLMFLTADPPWHATVGVVWHDEGAWTHNARNRALFGTWRTDEWNPMYIAPVFTALEYVSFATLGVGLWQARLVSALAGMASVLLLGLGVARVGGRRAGLIAAALLATNYVYVMYTRAALMEATMVAWLVVSWYCYVRAAERPVWGVAAGAAAVLAFFTKASAVSFLGALGLVALLELANAGRLRGQQQSPPGARPISRRAAWVTLAGLAVAGLAAMVALVPHWHEYHFYNWQVSVTRKPSYTLKAVLDRASWFPIVHDFFTRMWLVTVLASAACLGALVRWRALHPAERLLMLWVGLGAAQLVLHDTGNERRLVFLIPPMVALAALALGRDRRLLAAEAAAVPLSRAVLAAPLVMAAFYVILGAMARLPFLYQVRPGVWLGAALAALAGAAVYLTWPRVPRWLAAQQVTATGALVVTALAVAGDLLQFGQWTAVRSYKNVEASRALGEWLPPGTPVHGKLSNGLALENAIRPIFVGRGFGNYEDRLERDDVRYILTYVEPWIGFEGPVIRDVLAEYPDWRILRTFDVAETTGGRDRAALIEKWPGAARGVPREAARAGH
jgi:4-amino-4-deoxy-L-arabinose transferase-like glycosyltransferase